MYGWKPSSSSNLSIRAFRVYPLVEIRQTVPCRAIRGKSSDSRRRYLNQQHPPPPLTSDSVLRRGVRAEAHLALTAAHDIEPIRASKEDWLKLQDSTLIE